MLWSTWRMVLWCQNERRDFLGCFSLMLVPGKMFVLAGVSLERKLEAGFQNADCFG